jgi:hypothetical protein
MFRTTFRTTLLTASLALLVVACGDDGSSGPVGGSPPGDACAPAEGCPEVVSECVAFEDNAGKDAFSLRISDLQISSPAALNSQVVAGLLALGITPDYEQCVTVDNLPLFTGDGSFNWILNFDRTAGTLRTGGAELETDPNAGYCFIDGMIGGFDVAPLELPATFNADGSFVLDGFADVVVPIFTSPTDAASVILLPLRGVSITDGVISSDNNCMGSFNAAELDPQNLCKPNLPTVPAFKTGANLDGYITLEDADAVTVPQLGGASLCTLLTTADFIEDMKCKRMNGDILLEGDWCAGAEGEPGTPATDTCKDSVRLSAKFAASGAKLRSDCN